MGVLQFDEAIKLLKLDVAVEYRNKHNPSGGLPYHHNQHMDFMLEDCINAYTYSLLDEVPSTVKVNYNALMFAAIFHDCDHSGGKLLDVHNVDKAIIFWKRFLDSEEGKTLRDRFGYRILKLSDVIVFLLRATQYPYVVLEDTPEFKDLNKYQQNPSFLETARVIRDADLMTIYHGDVGINMVNWGIWEEMSVKGGVYEKAHGELTYNDFVVKQIEFTQNRVWNSAWGRRRADLLDYPSVAKKVLANLETNRILFTYPDVAYD